MHRTSLLIRGVGKSSLLQGVGTFLLAPRTWHGQASRDVAQLWMLGSSGVMHSLTLPDWSAEGSWPLPVIITAAASSNLFQHNIFNSPAKSFIGFQGEVCGCGCGRHRLCFALDGGQEQSGLAPKFRISICFLSSLQAQNSHLAPEDTGPQV